MERTHRLFALVAAAMLVTSAFGLGAVAGASAANTSGNLAVGVTQGDDVTVTVTDNGTAVDGAAVDVSATNGSYEGTGSYKTDNGTVSLPAPEENVTVTVTAAYDNDTASTTVDLVAVNESDDGNESDAFGQEVSAFVHGVLTDGTEGPPGLIISQWVVENNPGNADPPAFDDNRTRGPPEDRGPDANETDDDDANETDDGNETERGPPEDAGPDGDKERGPPEDRGNDADDEDSEEEAETEEEDDDADEEDDTDDSDGDEDEDDDGGPPEDRGGNGNGR